MAEFYEMLYLVYFKRILKNIFILFQTLLTWFPNLSLKLFPVVKYAD